MINPDQNLNAQTASPAEALQALLAERGWSQSDLAYVLGVNSAAVNPILAGKRGISPDMAKALAAAFHVPIEHFVTIQAQWELQRARDPDPAVRARAAIQTEYPLREMRKRGWIGAESGDVAADLCSFFEVRTLADVPHMDAARRASTKEVPATQLAWLFRVRQIAKELPTPPYSRSKLIEAVEAMRGMRETPEEIRLIPRLLNDAGVRFVIVESLPGGKIDGVCLWLDKQTPVIGMSLRFDRIDNFWFVLRHECAHVLHGHGQTGAIIDSDIAHRDNQEISEEERVADAEAADFCIPQEKMHNFYLRKNPFFPERDVLAFAKLAKVHPGLVVGQLQRLIKRYDFLRKYLVGVRSHISRTAPVDGWGDVFPVG